MGREPATSGVEAAGARDIADAHRELLTDKTLQFDVTRFKPQEPPRWLAGLGEALAAMSPLFQVLFWVAVVVGVGVLLYFIARAIVSTRLEGRPGNGPKLSNEPDWRPTVEQAQVLLADADALAAEGRYDEAAHLLLLRGVQDIRDQRPGLVRPALTSRDIAALEALPAAARTAFGAIALVVERSYFGGRDVGADGWATCRGAYEQFALGGAR